MIKPLGVVYKTSDGKEFKTEKAMLTYCDYVGAEGELARMVEQELPNYFDDNKESEYYATDLGMARDFGMDFLLMCADNIKLINQAVEVSNLKKAYKEEMKNEK